MGTSKTMEPAVKMGIQIAHWAKWDGVQICEAFLAALTDANFHSLAAELKPIIAAEMARE